MSVGIYPETARMVLIPPYQRTFDYITTHVRNRYGFPFNPIDYPWTEGICDAYDDPAVRNIWLQMAARTGKTTIAMSILVKSIATDPCTWMFGSATETALKDTVRDGYYPMFERCNPTRHWVPIPSKRIQTRIDLATCRGYGAWSGSSMQLADKDPKYMHGGEVDKWTKEKSSEADSFELFLERGLEIPDRKGIFESTPEITHRSRIEYYVKQGWNCRFQCACPKCQFFQQLVFGAVDKSGRLINGGILFDRKDGLLDPATALKTARYQCANCKAELDDDYRRPMIRGGIWVPEGQRLTKSRRLIGTMANPGPDASFQISRIYAPTFTFGMMARAFCQFYNKGNMQSWNNSWLGTTWAPVVTQDTWDEVANRLALGYELGSAPEFAVFLTCAVDVQVDHFKFKVYAWGSEQRGAMIDYGVLYSWQDVAHKIRNLYPHDDGGEPIHIGLTLIDARDGNRQDEVIEFCRAVNHDDGPWVWPCMGAAAGAMGLTPYSKKVVTEDNKVGRTINRQSTAFGVVKVNTNYWQQWLHNALYHRDPNTPRSIAVPESVVTDQTLFEEMTNELPDTREDMTDHEHFVWVVVDKRIAVDYRDCARYCRCAAEVYTRGNWEMVKPRRDMLTVSTQVPAQPTDSPKSTFLKKNSMKERWLRGLSNRRYGNR